MQRQRILKTYKLYIGGKFPRTESGRYFRPTDKEGEPLANICRASRKDLRNAVVAARKVQEDWAGRSGYNRGQILYRTAEMLEGRKAQFIEELMQSGRTKKESTDETNATIDLLVHYAGWCDKYQTLISSVNPVNSPHFNFTVPEATGVVAIVAPEERPLFALADLMASSICGGNTAVILASEQAPMVGMSFAEVLHASDVPAGVVNLLTGHREELIPHMASHMDVNAMIVPNDNGSDIATVQEKGAENLKRVHVRTTPELTGKGSLERIAELQEIKTTWHPVESSL